MFGWLKKLFGGAPAPVIEDVVEKKAPAKKPRAPRKPKTEK